MEIVAIILAGVIIFVIVMADIEKGRRWKRWKKGSYPKDGN